MRKGKPLPSDTSLVQVHANPVLDAQCQWRTKGRRCFLIGDISPDIGDNRREYCHWHFVCLRNPKDSDNFEEFCRWNAGWERYCSLENHFDAEIIWDAIQGLAPIHGEPHWCGLVCCKLFDISDTVAWVKEGKGLEVGTWWRVHGHEHGAKTGKRPPIVDIRNKEMELWTPKTILARKALGLPVPVEEPDGIVESNVPF